MSMANNQIECWEYKLTFRLLSELITVSGHDQKLSVSLRSRVLPWDFCRM